MRIILTVFYLLKHPLCGFCLRYGGDAPGGAVFVGAAAGFSVRVPDRGGFGDFYRRRAGPALCSGARRAGKGPV